MRPDSPLRKFDPEKVARYETDSYVAYYRKDWIKLLHSSVGLVSEVFGLPWPPFVFAAYLIAQAQIAFAPFPNNDIPKAESYIRRFYQLVKHVDHEEFDVERATKLEINWWILHRELFGNPENEPLVKALQAIYAEAYGVDADRLYEAARLRAQGMLYSDLWVKAGKPANSPLLAQEEEALRQSYIALKQAIS